MMHRPPPPPPPPPSNNQNNDPKAQKQPAKQLFNLFKKTAAKKTQAVIAPTPDANLTTQPATIPSAPSEQQQQQEQPAMSVGDRQNTEKEEEDRRQEEFMNKMTGHNPSAPTDEQDDAQRITVLNMDEGQLNDEFERAKEKERQQKHEDNEYFMNKMNGFDDEIQRKDEEKKLRLEEEEKERQRKQLELRQQQLFNDDLVVMPEGDASNFSNAPVPNQHHHQHHLPYASASAPPPPPDSAPPPNQQLEQDDYNYQLRPSPSAPPAPTQTSAPSQEQQHPLDDQATYQLPQEHKVYQARPAPFTHQTPEATKMAEMFGSKAFGPGQLFRKASNSNINNNNNSYRANYQTEAPRNVPVALPQPSTQPADYKANNPTGWSAVEESMQQSQPTYDKPLHSSIFRKSDENIFDIDSQLKIKIRAGRQLGVEAVDLEEQGRLKEAEKKYIKALSALFPMMKELDKGTDKNIDERKRQKMNIKKEVTAMMDRCERIKNALKVSAVPDVPRGMPKPPPNNKVGLNQPVVTQRNIVNAIPNATSPPDVPSIMPKSPPSEFRLNEPRKLPPNENMRHEDVVKTPREGFMAGAGGFASDDKTPPLMSRLESVQSAYDDSVQEEQPQVNHVKSQQQSPKYVQEQNQPRYEQQNQQQYRHQLPSKQIHSPSAPAVTPSHATVPQQYPPYEHVGSNVTEHEEEVGKPNDNATFHRRNPSSTFNADTAPLKPEERATAPTSLYPDAAIPGPSVDETNRGARNERPSNLNVEYPDPAADQVDNKPVLRTFSNRRKVPIKSPQQSPRHFEPAEQRDANILSNAQLRGPAYYEDQQNPNEKQARIPDTNRFDENIYGVQSGEMNPARELTSRLPLDDDEETEDEGEIYQSDVNETAAAVKSTISRGSRNTSAAASPQHPVETADKHQFDSPDIFSDDSDTTSKYAAPESAKMPRLGGTSLQLAEDIENQRKEATDNIQKRKSINNRVYASPPPLPLMHGEEDEPVFGLLEHAKSNEHENLKCVICHGAAELKSNRCGHGYCSTCGNQSVAVYGKCPLPDCQLPLSMEDFEHIIR